MTSGVGKTKVGTSLGFNIMGNPFNVEKLTEKQAIDIIKAEGFRYKRVKSLGKTYCVKPIGNNGDVRDFIDRLIESKIYITDGGIAVK